MQLSTDGYWEVPSVCVVMVILASGIIYYIFSCHKVGKGE